MSVAKALSGRRPRSTGGHGRRSTPSGGVSDCCVPRRLRVQFRRRCAVAKPDHWDRTACWFSHQGCSWRSSLMVHRVVASTRAPSRRWAGTCALAEVRPWPRRAQAAGHPIAHDLSRPVGACSGCQWRRRSMVVVDPGLGGFRQVARSAQLTGRGHRPSPASPGGFLRTMLLTGSSHRTASGGRLRRGTTTAPSLEGRPPRTWWLSNAFVTGA